MDKFLKKPSKKVTKKVTKKYKIRTEETELNYNSPTDKAVKTKCPLSVKCTNKLRNLAVIEELMLCTM